MNKRIRFREFSISENIRKNLRVSVVVDYSDAQRYPIKKNIQNHIRYLMQKNPRYIVPTYSYTHLL